MYRPSYIGTPGDSKRDAGKLSFTPLLNILERDPPSLFEYLLHHGETEECTRETNS
jgi:hypothetical protein